MAWKHIVVSPELHTKIKIFAATNDMRMIDVITYMYETAENAIVYDDRRKKRSETSKQSRAIDRIRKRAVIDPSESAIDKSEDLADQEQATQCADVSHASVDSPEQDQPKTRGLNDLPALLQFFGSAKMKKKFSEE